MLFGSLISRPMRVFFALDIHGGRATWITCVSVYTDYYCHYLSSQICIFNFLYFNQIALPEDLILRGIFFPSLKALKSNVYFIWFYFLPLSCILEKSRSQTRSLIGKLVVRHVT